MAADSQFREAALRAADGDIEIDLQAKTLIRNIKNKRSKERFSTEDAVEVIGALGAFLNKQYPATGVK